MKEDWTSRAVIEENKPLNIRESELVIKDQNSK